MPDIEPNEAPVVTLGPQIAGGLIMVVLAIAAMSRVGCNNHHTPPGHAGYIRSTPLVGAGEFVGTQIGPTSTGWVWRQTLVNIDIRPKNYTEAIVNIVARGGLRIDLRAHARIKPNPNQVKELFNTFGGENWYVSNVQQQFKAAVRKRVQEYDPLEIKSNMRIIGETVLADMVETYKESPVIFLSVDIGDITYPEKIVDAVVRKMVTKEDEERASIQLEIERKKIAISQAGARGIAKAQEVILSTLDPMFLQFEALRAMEDLADSKNTNFLIMPVSENGTSPVIMQMGN